MTMHRAITQFEQNIIRVRALGGLFEAMDTLSFDDAATRDGLGVDTRFEGTRADPTVRGSISRIGLDNFTPEHLIAGFADGIARELKGFSDLFPRVVRAANRDLIGSGGQIRKSRVQRAALEKAFGRPLRIPLSAEEAALGAALYAAVGVGGIHDIASAGSLIRYG